MLYQCFKNKIRIIPTEHTFVSELKIFCVFFSGYGSNQGGGGGGGSGFGNGGGASGKKADDGPLMGPAMVEPKFEDKK